jgi:hypothetical protein
MAKSNCAHLLRIPEKLSSAATNQMVQVRAKRLADMLNKIKITARLQALVVFLFNYFSKLQHLLRLKIWFAVQFETLDH